MWYNPNIYQILPKYNSRWKTGGISHISAHKIYGGISHIMRIWEQVYLVLASRAGDTGCGHDVELSSLVAISWQRSNKLGSTEVQTLSRCGTEATETGAKTIKVQT